ncbi:hypothetical protein BDK51DRAFT_32956, partial [Blyttiomyces helicus]
YTKALENIKTLRKSHTSELNGHRATLDTLKKEKDTAAEMRDRLAETKDALGAAQARIDLLDSGEVEDVLHKMNNLMEQNREVSHLQNKIETIKARRDGLTRGIEELKQELVIFEESDEELKRLRDTYAAQVEAKAGEQADLDRRMATIESDMELVSDELSASLTELGALRSAAERHEQRVQDRESLVRSLSQKYLYQGFEGKKIGPDAVVRFKRKLQANIDDKSGSIAAMKMSMKEREGELQSEIQKLKSNLASLEEAKRMTRKQQDSNRQRMAQAMQRIQGMKLSQVEVDELETRITEETLEVKAATDGFSLADSEAKLRRLAQEVQDLEHRLTSGSAELSTLTMQSSDFARLGIMKGERERKKELIKKTMAAAEKDFNSFLGHVPPLASMEKEVGALLRAKEKELRNTEDRYAEKSRDLASIQAKLGMSSHILDVKTAALEGEDTMLVWNHPSLTSFPLQKNAERMDRIRPVIGDGDFATERQLAEDAMLAKKDAGITMISLVKMYERFIENFKEKDWCPLCHRGFQPPEDQDFLEKLHRKIAKAPESMRQQEDAMAQLEARVQQLRDLQTTWDDAERLRSTEIPEIRERLAEYEEDAKAIKEDCEGLDSTLSVVKLELQSVQGLHGQVDGIVRIDRELRSIEDEIARLELNLSGSGSTRTLEEVQREQETLQTQCNFDVRLAFLSLISKTIRREMDRVNAESRSKQNEIQARERRLRATQDKLQSLRLKLQERSQLEKSLEEMKADGITYSKEIESCDSRILEIDPKIRALEADLNDYRQEMTQKEAEYMREVAGLQQSMSRLNDIETEIERYVAKSGESQLTETEAHVKALQVRIGELEASKTATAARAQEIRTAHSEVETLRRRIDENMRLRRMFAETEELETKLANFRAQLGGFDQESINTRYNKLKRKHEGLVAERAGLVGESKQMAEQVRQTEHLLDKYADVDEQFRKQLIQLKTSEMANNDLEKYSKALEMWMEEINKIIRELWVNTYRGSDIDTIEIRSDNENVKGNRTYNYRNPAIMNPVPVFQVVMIKGNTTLDMRGRCSAGQKVITSLIVRLALAETFCINCGILALDEPTTNLDRANIESLAESLANIIKTRRHQKNFQLIIITHDEEFMQLLGKSEYADYYWRVAKDEGGHSFITRHTIQADDMIEPNFREEDSQLPSPFPHLFHTLFSECNTLVTTKAYFAGEDSFGENARRYSLEEGAKEFGLRNWGGASVNHPLPLETTSSPTLGLEITTQRPHHLRAHSPSTDIAFLFVTSEEGDKEGPTYESNTRRFRETLKPRKDQ